MGIYEPYVKADNAKKKGKFTPRPEQSDAIDRAFKYFKKNDGKGAEFLWNAKMRFGKTVCALWLIEKLNKELGKKKVLIVTHRPVVNASWYGDFCHLFKKSLNQYSYGTARETDDESSMKGFYDISSDAKSGKCVLFFASMQYLRLSKLVGGKQDDSKEKEDILNYDWDLVIIDEAHEGTQTELGEGVINYLHKDKTFMLHLSGTPFNLLDKFKSEQIYNWDYIKEQQYKRQWDKDHENKKAKASPSFFDNEEEEVNPYRELPQMEILTFRLGDMIDEQTIQDAATGKFSFTEFFRVKKGHDVPKEERGKFLHEEQVLAFIKKLCEKSDVSHYPFSNDEYRNCFRHTLWVVPGVPEAQALKRLLESTPLCKNPKFGFKVINVAGNSDDDEQRSNALDKVLNAIGIDEKNNIDNSGQTRTITLSCGRLTTGVTVRPWTAVLYLKGSDTTSASTYMQTIFRVQSPHTLNGMMKSKCYVFDFAPERALTMMAETAKYSREFIRKEEKKGVKKQKSVIDAEDKEQMSKLIDVCPIIETTNGCPVIIQGKMQPIDCNRLFSQLNSVYVDKVVRNGFDHPSLYNYNEFLKLDLEDEFNLNYIDSMFGDEGKSGGSGDGKEVVVNTQDDLTPEQKAALEKERKEREEAAKKAREEAKKKYEEKLAKMTPEEREAFLKEKEEHARKLKLIHQSKDKLSGLSKRIPLMMYGANVEDFKEVTIDNFTDKRFIDDESWNEFMPKGVSRELFKKLSKFYNADVFKEAGVRIRQLALEADTMKVEERIARIAQIFKWFKNPDKETVLTPWEVVNRHMNSTLGGYTFFEDDFKTPYTKVDEKTGEIIETGKPRFVDRGEITKNVFGNVTSGNIDITNGKINTKILEINSKTGLYPLYVAYSLYKTLLPIWAGKDDPDDYSADDEHVVWDNVVSNNLYVICNTKMAERITRRTLLGFREKDSNGKEIQLHVKQDKLITRVGKDKEALITDLRSNGYWNNNKMRNKEITFNAVVGNPPYQMTIAKKDTDNGQKRVKSIFHLFQNVSENVGNFTSLIYPGGRWIHRSGKGMTEFGLTQINDPHLRKLLFFPNCNELFADAGIADGISIVLKDMKKVSNGFDYIYSESGRELTIFAQNPGEVLMSLNPANDIILDKINNVVLSKGFKYLHDSVLSQKLFGIESSFIEDNPSLVREYNDGDSFNTDTEVKLYTNDKAGKSGRSRWYVTNRSIIPEGRQYIDEWKVVVSSANAGGQKRSNQIAILDNHSVFGRSRVALKTFKTQKEAHNFFIYANSFLIRFAFLMTDEALTSLAKRVPDIMNYSDDNGIIDFNKDINSQLYSLFNIKDDNEKKYIENIIAAKGY